MKPSSNLQPKKQTSMRKAANRRRRRQSDLLHREHRNKYERDSMEVGSSSSGAGGRPEIDPVAGKQRKPGERERNHAWPAYISALALWLSFPPAGLGWLAWLAPSGWLSYLDRPTVGRRGYLHLWLSGCVFWLAILQGVRLAYWPLYFGWLALSLYLAVYIPLFVYIARRLIARRVTFALAASISWTGLELTRSFMLTGFAANSLAHTQAQYPVVIQIVDQVGGYGLGFLMMLCCASTYRALQSLTIARSKAEQGGSQGGWVKLSTAFALVLATLAYGWYRLREADQLYAESEPLLSALLVQENTPSMFDADASNPREAWSRYLDATRSLVAELGRAELVVWPESTFTATSPWVAEQLPQRLPPEMLMKDMDRELVANWVQQVAAEFEMKTRLVLEAAGNRDPTSPANDLSESSASDSTLAFGIDGKAAESESEASKVSHDGPFLLLGSDAWEITEQEWRRYNSALLIDRQGRLIDRYNKMHLVMFGEYIPLGPALQWLRDIFGISGIDAGDAPKRFKVGEVSISPSICFESMMPRLIRRQVHQLRTAGKAPQLLINITNDSWFRGSSILDHHLACSILCAVENRLPLLVAANTGLSAEIDGCGRLRQVTERLSIEGIMAKPIADGRWGLVQSAGYPLAWVCLGLVLASFVPRRAASHDTPKQPPAT